MIIGCDIGGVVKEMTSDDPIENALESIKELEYGEPTVSGFGDAVAHRGARSAHRRDGGRYDDEVVHGRVLRTHRVIPVNPSLRILQRKIQMLTLCVFMRLIQMNIYIDFLLRHQR